jgi:transcriptional regulator with XRE-family HTH domain
VRAGLNYKNLSHYESGKFKPGNKILQKIAEVFGMTLDQLLTDTDSEFSEKGLADHELLDCFKLLEKMGEEDKRAIKHLIQALAIKQQVQCLGKIAG